MSAIVQLNFIPKRLLTKAQAAYHCGRPLRRFEVECDISPVKFPKGDSRYDVQDLDKWIDGLKTRESSDADEVIGRLR